MKLKKVQIIGAFLAAVISAGVYSAPGNVVYADSSVGTASASAGIAVPSNFTCKTTATSITLGWDTVDGADAYRVYKYDPSSGEYEKYKNVAGNSCSITGLAKGTKYYFKVAVLYKSGKSYIEGTQSKAVSAATKTSDLPAAPSANFTGFISQNGKNYYFLNGKLVTGWQVINGSTYYFGSDYSMHTGWLNAAGGVRYFLYSDGTLARDITLWIDNISYTFDKNGAASLTVTHKMPEVTDTVELPELPIPPAGENREKTEEYNKLSTRSKEAANAICICINQFKDPSSVRVREIYDYNNLYDEKTGEGWDIKGYWVKISAKNSFGGTDVKWYLLRTGGSKKSEGSNDIYYNKYFQWGLNDWGEKGPVTYTGGNWIREVDVNSSYENEIKQINKAIAEYLDDVYGY